MTAPDHLKITGPEDILGFIPHSLGYWPTNSLVAMTMQGKRLGATLRVDLPDSSRCRGSGLAAFARTVRDYLTADDEADGALLAFFSGPAAEGGGGGSGSAMAAAVGDGGVGADDPAGAHALAGLLRELEHTLGRRGPAGPRRLVGRGAVLAQCQLPGPRVLRPAGPADRRDQEQPPERRAGLPRQQRGCGPEAAATAAAAGRSPNPPCWQHRRAGPGSSPGRWRDRAQFAAVLDVWERVLRAPGAPVAGRAAQAAALDGPRRGCPSGAGATGPGRCAGGPRRLPAGHPVRARRGATRSW